jgi:D-sedoheptulose 7-phosphate isomerase
MEMANHHSFESYLNRLFTALGGVDRAALDATVEALITVHKAGGSIFIMGNGGSASTATHMACDLSLMTTLPNSQGLVVWSLTDNPAIITATSNDRCYEIIFSSMIRQRVRARDLLIAISASGNSPNILEGVKVAKEIGCLVIGFTGFDGGLLARQCDILIHGSGDDYGPVEDVHLICNHYIVESIRIKFAGGIS